MENDLTSNTTTSIPKISQIVDLEKEPKDKVWKEEKMEEEVRDRKGNMLLLPNIPPDRLNKIDLSTYDPDNERSYTRPRKDSICSIC